MGSKRLQSNLSYFCISFCRKPQKRLQYRTVAEGLPKNVKFIVIDEIQKVPKLLDILHLLIEKKQHYFALTGSSARKLKRGGANLLADPAFIFHLFPFTYQELQENFEVGSILRWGSLPKIFESSEEISKKRYLQAYANTYLKEEVWGEQLLNPHPHKCGVIPLGCATRTWPAC